MPGAPQEKAAGVQVLKEVEELAVSKLEASQQSASDASCQAAKQFLHEAPYEQVLPRPRPCPTCCQACLYGLLDNCTASHTSCGCWHMFYHLTVTPISSFRGE